MSQSGSSGMTASALRRAALYEFWLTFSRNRGAVIGLLVFLAIVLVAVFAPVLAPYDYGVQFRGMEAVPPFWQEHGSTRFLLGTDAVGRDMLSRLMYGAQSSLMVGVAVACITMVLGVILGVFSGYLGGFVDYALMRVTDILLTFPPFLLALVLVNIVGKGLGGVCVATIIAMLPAFVRLSRAAVMAEKNREYVIGARVAGAGPLRLMFKTILPNCFAPLIVQGTFAFSDAILNVAALGFLLMGAQPPTPEWGTMLADAREFVIMGTQKWWIVTLPGLAILTLVLAINLVGDGLRDALDPKLRRS